MEKYFNIEGTCYPDEHYMVNLDKRIEEISKLIEKNKYFSMNRARQYGKTTTLNMLKQKLSNQYTVFLISFEGLPMEAYESEETFCRRLCRLLADAIFYREVTGIPSEIEEELSYMCQPDVKHLDLGVLSNFMTKMCMAVKKPVVLMIDEVDQASNQEIFLAFLGMLRDKYLNRKTRQTFQSVILAGVYDVRNLKIRMRPEGEHQKNSPWNIAAKFTLDMELDIPGIKGMLEDYENDHHLGIKVNDVAKWIYDYTSGYPFLVSALCKIMDEELVFKEICENKSQAWSREGFLSAVKILLQERNTLFDSLRNKLEDYPQLKNMLYDILFHGKPILYNQDNSVIEIASMFGFVKNEDGMLAVANRIFETRLYNLFMSEENLNSDIFDAGVRDKNQFVYNGVLNMELVMERFMIHFNELYGDSDEKFIEDNGRKFFLLFLKPIINGVGNYYIEAETRDQRRTDIIIDYLGRQYIIEIKIWRGNAYNTRGERQLADYLDAYHQKKGYLLSFNFNKNKEIGAKVVQCGEKTIFEVVV